MCEDAALIARGTFCGSVGLSVYACLVPHLIRHKDLGDSNDFVFWLTEADKNRNLHSL